MRYDLLVALLDVLVGALLGLAVSLAIWWVQYRVLVPRLEFSPQMAKQPFADGSVYRFRIYNASRSRGVLDLNFNVRVHFKAGPIRDTARQLSASTSLRIFTATDEIMRVAPRGARIVRLDLRVSNWTRANPRLLKALDVPETGEVSLEHLLKATKDAYVRVQVLGYDEVTGTRKYFASDRYYLDSIAVGSFHDGMRVTRTN